MNWLNFLHFYQPANIDAYRVEEAVEKSYERIIRGLEENKNIKFTANISGALWVRLKELKRFDLIERLQSLQKNGQLEIVGSLAYHALAPLVTSREILAQIKEQEDIANHFLGKKLPKNGFFLPEMAYSPKVAKLIKKAGYKWIIVDQIAGREKNSGLEIARDKNSGLFVFFRERSLSETYVPDTLLNFFDHSSLAVTATDAELYGLRHEDPTGEFEKILKNKKIKTTTFSEHLKSFLKTRVPKNIPLISCSWDSKEKELKKGQPYFIWQNKKNKIQNLLWEIADLAEKTVWDYRRDPNAGFARWHLVRGLASCTFWWASANDFAHKFGPAAWSPDEIERGLNELIRAIRSLESKKTRATKIKAEKLYLKIKKLIWEKHWSCHF